MGANTATLAVFQDNALHQGLFTGSIDFYGRVRAIDPAEHALNTVVLNELGHVGAPVTSGIVMGIARLPDDAALVELVFSQKIHSDTTSLFARSTAARLPSMTT